MTRQEKMLRIMDILKHRANFKVTEHLTAQYGKDSISYYYANVDFFQLGYKGIFVNVNGQIEKSLEMDLDIDKWLDELLVITSQKICLIDGKEYILTEIGS